MYSTSKLDVMSKTWKIQIRLPFPHLLQHTYLLTADICFCTKVCDSTHTRQQPTALWPKIPVSNILVSNNSKIYSSRDLLDRILIKCKEMRGKRTTPKLVSSYQNGARIRAQSLINYTLIGAIKY